MINYGFPVVMVLIRTTGLNAHRAPRHCSPAPLPVRAFIIMLFFPVFRACLSTGSLASPSHLYLSLTSLRSSTSPNPPSSPFFFSGASRICAALLRLRAVLAACSHVRNARVLCPRFKRLRARASSRASPDAAAVAAPATALASVLPYSSAIKLSLPRRRRRN